MTLPIVVFITSPKLSLDTTLNAIRSASEIVGKGRLLVQFRDKEAPAAAQLASARILRAVTRDVGAWLVINGSLEVAYETAADGVHFPNEGVATETRVAAARALLGERAFVTTTAHSDADVRHATNAGATAVLVSPVFESPGKGAPRGLGALTSARSIVASTLQGRSMLVYALGGVTHERVRACVHAGADGVAAIRGVYESNELACAAVSAYARRVVPVSRCLDEC